MKRLLFSCSVLLLTGLYLGFFISSTAKAVVIIAALAAGIIKAVKSLDFYTKISALFLSFSLILGIFLIPVYEISQTTGLDAGQNVTLRLRVSEKPEINSDYCSYVCDMISVTDDESTRQAGGTIRLSYSAGENILSFGDIFTAPCKITETSKPLNRGGFDYGLYLKTKGILTSGYITSNNLNIVSQNNYTLKDSFKLLNMRLCEGIDENFKEDDALLLKAILLGEKTDMPPDFYSDLKRSGLSHVTAVSGMHLSYIIMILVAFSRLFKIRKRVFAVFFIGFSVCFMLLTGMSPSVVRATIMVCCIFSGNLFLRRSDALTSMGLAAIIIVFSNPYAAFDTSFILSFSATAGILILAGPLEKLLTAKPLLKNKKLLSRLFRYCISLISVSISAQLFTIPFSALLWGEFSLWTIPANILITPLLPVILGAGFLFCISSIVYMPLGALIAKALSVFTAAARIIISFFSTLDFGIMRFGRADALFILIYLLIIVIILLFLYKKRAYIIYAVPILLIAVTFAFFGNISRSSAAYVTFINVGQGDSSLITLPGDVNILIDGGEGPADTESDSASSTVNSYLAKNGIKNIDFMVATHSNSDHIGGLISAIDYYKVDTLIIPPSFKDGELSEKLLKAAEENGTEVRVLTTGDSVLFTPEITMTALLPDDYLAENTDSQNNTSLVLRLDCFETSFLFTGDLEASAERYMIKRISDKLLDTDVLKVSHHGSDTSTTEAFLEKVTPRFAVIPVGENSFGHPSSKVLSRLKDIGAAVFRTDINRDVIFVLTTEGISNIIYN